MASPKCDKIYIRVPGEHVINDNVYKMELQFNCKGHPNFSDISNDLYTKIAVPVVIDNEESKIFNNISADKILEDEYITITGIDDFLNYFTTTHNVVYYKGNNDFILKGLCAPEGEQMWIVLTEPLKINQEKYDKFKSMIFGNTNISPTGNNRIVTEPGSPDNLYLINYSK